MDERTPPQPRPDRRMVRAKLSGAPTHETESGLRVPVWRRGGDYRPRGRYQGRAFGRTLGDTEKGAKIALRRLLTELDDGTFRPPGEARRRPVNTRSVPRLDLRQLLDRFLAEKRRLRGHNTMR